MSDLAISAVDLMDVEKLGMISATDDAISYFNQAFPPPKEADEAIKQAEVVWAQLLSPEERENVSGGIYSSRDGKYIWDALLCKELSYHALGTTDTDLSRVVNVFQFVVRNLPLMNRHLNDLPLTLQEIWTMGRATTEDRAWAFAAILRQLRIDSVLLFSAEKEEGTRAPFLIAVLLNDEAYLFDPRLGLPIPGPETDKPATLSEVLAAPEILTQLAIDTQPPYPLTADALSHPRVKLIGDSCSWAPRMRLLEDAFLGERRVQLYEGLQDENGQPGYLKRVADAGGDHWTSESISIWEYPETQAAGSEVLSVSQQESLRSLKDSWRASWEGTFSAPSQSGGFFASTRSQFMARTKQLVGDYSAAVKLYVQIGITNHAFNRLKEGALVPTLFPEKSGVQAFDDSYDAAEKEKLQKIAQVRAIKDSTPQMKQELVQNLLKLHENNIRQYKVAARDSSYWIGVCHFESGRIPASRETFERYLSKNPSGIWSTSSRFYIATGQAAEGDLTAAVATLSETAPRDPAYDGHQIQIRQWKQQMSGPSK